MRNLGLTSPHTKGDDVKALQDALKGKHYLQGDVDGEFGDETARAVYRAKYWLGYKIPNRRAGDLLYSYLTGRKAPTAVMKQRTANRKARQHPTNPIRTKMFNEAKKWIGTKENPFGSNRCKFSIWYGFTGPWCAMFVTFCGAAVGSKAFIRNRRYSYCPNLLDDARRGRNGVAITYSPHTGDLVLFDWQGNGTPDHVGFFGEWLDHAHTKFSTIEGNTGHGNDSNGGEVMWRERYKTNVRAFVHVGA